MGTKGITLMEILVVIILIGILSAIALPNFTKTREHALGKEAIANLKLIAAAERIYRLETGFYYPYSGSQSDAEAVINPNLKLSLNETYWDYSITGGTASFTAYAYRQGSGGYLDCYYSFPHTDDEPIASSSCP